MWCEVLDDRATATFTFVVCLAGKVYLYLQEELPRTLEDVPLSIRGRVYFLHDGTSLHFSRVVKNFVKNIIQFIISLYYIILLLRISAYSESY